MFLPRISCRPHTVLFGVSGLLALAGLPVTMAADTAALTIAVKPIEPFVIVEEGDVRGYSIDVWNAITDQLAQTSRFQVKATVADVLEAVADGSADAAIAAITITAEREANLDFAHAYFKSGLRVAVPTRVGSSWLTTIRRFFSGDFLGMFGILVGLTFLTANMLWIVERRINPECFPRSYVHGVGESMWWSVATIITGGCENKSPVSLAGRLVAVAWMLGSIMLVASFTATLSSQMTAESVTGAIGGPTDLPGRPVATVRGTAAVADLKSMNARVVECASLADAVAAVDAGRADAVVFDEPVLAYFINSSNRSPVRLVGPTFEKQDYGIALPAGSDLREAINNALLKLQESGTLSAIDRKWFGVSE